jgi:ABC-2 type transport system ATP-binding protein
MPTCLHIANVTKHYGSTVAVSDFSLEVEAGEVLGLLGPNGAGKSTTLLMVAGLVRPNAGSITVFGKDVRKHFVEVAGRMGVATEMPSFYEYLTVRRNLRLQARLARREVNIDRILDLLGLLRVAGKKAGHLSRGQRQRLGLAQALLTEPDLLLLDEPTAGLDVEATQEVLRLLRRLREKAGVTIVFSSHLMREVESLCDRVAIMNEGKLLTCDRTDALLTYDGHHVEVLLEGGERAAKRLAEQPWVIDVRVNPGRLAVHLGEGSPNQLNSFLVNAGYQVTGLIPRRHTLQDFFLKIMNTGEGA